MEINTNEEKNALIVSIKGRLDAASSPEFEKEMKTFIAAGSNVFIIDLGELEYVSSAGLRSILVIARTLKAKEGQLLLAALKDVVKEVFDISGFGSIIPIYGSLDSALAEIKQD